MKPAGLALLLLAVAGCDANTNRPPYAPLPEAVTAVVRLDVEDATRLLASELEADSLPVERVEVRDGFVDTGWFTFPGYSRPDAPPLGPAVDRIRGWVDPAQRDHSRITLETAYQALVDPSRDPRDGQRTVGEFHTARLKSILLLRRIAARFGDTTELPVLRLPGQAQPPPAAPVSRPDTATPRTP